MSLKNITQGGQVTLHNINMFRQVLTVTLLITAISGGLFWGCKTWFSYTPDERYALFSFYWADMKLSVSGNKEQEMQIYRYPNGSEHTVRCIDIKNNNILQYWGRDFEGRMVHNAWLSLWFMGGVFALLIGFCFWRGRVKKSKEILSGTAIVKPAVLQKMLKRQKIVSPFHLGRNSLRLNSETQHFLFCGTTGTGKSNCFMELFPQIRAKGHKAIVVDTTGEFVSRFYREGQDILINPFDQRTVGWNPWIECQFPYHYDDIAQGFIPQTSHDKFWADSARTVLAESLAYFAREGTPDTEALLDLLLSCSLNDLYQTLQGTPAASLVDPAGDRTAMSIRSHLTPYLKSLKYLPTDKPLFSIRNWVAKGEGARADSWVFIVSTPDQRETLRPMITGLITVAINSLMTTQPNPDNRMWFFIDELISLNKQDSIPKALAEIRKYGGCIVAGIQNIPQLQEQYGIAETKSLTSLFNTKVVFRNTDPDTARYMSQILGEQEVREAVEGISFGAHQMRDGVSLNDQTRMKPIVSATEIMDLNDLEAYLKLPGSLPIAKLKFAINTAPNIIPAFISRF